MSQPSRRIGSWICRRAKASDIAFAPVHSGATKDSGAQFARQTALGFNHLVDSGKEGPDTWQILRSRIGIACGCQDGDRAFWVRWREREGAVLRNFAAPKKPTVVGLGNGQRVLAFVDVLQKWEMRRWVVERGLASGVGFSCSEPTQTSLYTRFIPSSPNWLDGAKRQYFAPVGPGIDLPLPSTFWEDLTLSSTSQSCGSLFSTTPPDNRIQDGRG